MARQAVTMTGEPKPGGMAVFVAEDKGEIIGMFVGMTATAYAAIAATVATNMLWYVRPGSPARVAWDLLQAWDAWLDQLPGQVMRRLSITDTILSGKAVPLAARAARRKGYRVCGVMLEKE